MREFVAIQRYYLMHGRASSSVHWAAQHHSRRGPTLPKYERKQAACADLQYVWASVIAFCVCHCMRQGDRGSTDCIKHLLSAVIKSVAECVWVVGKTPDDWESMKQFERAFRLNGFSEIGHFFSVKNIEFATPILPLSISKLQLSCFFYLYRRDFSLTLNVK